MWAADDWTRACRPGESPLSEWGRDRRVPESAPPRTIIAVDVDGEAACVELAGQLHRTTLVAERPDLDRKTLLDRRRGTTGRRRRGNRRSIHWDLRARGGRRASPGTQGPRDGLRFRGFLRTRGDLGGQGKLGGSPGQVIHHQVRLLPGGPRQQAHSETGDQEQGCPSQGREPARHGAIALTLPFRRHYILSGADMPSRPRPFASTVRTARVSPKRAPVSAASSDNTRCRLPSWMYGFHSSASSRR